MNFSIQKKKSLSYIYQKLFSCFCKDTFLRFRPVTVCYIYIIIGISKFKILKIISLYATCYRCRLINSINHPQHHQTRFLWHYVGLYCTLCFWSSCPDLCLRKLLFLGQHAFRFFINSSSPFFRTDESTRPMFSKTTKSFLSENYQN